MNPFEPTLPESSLTASICRCQTTHEHNSRAQEFNASSARASESAAEKKVLDANARIAEVERQVKIKADKLAAEFSAKSPDANRYEVVEAVEHYGNLVMRVLYPNCSACAYEGQKVMVFVGVSLTNAILWKKIDPHFRDPKIKTPRTEAPSPSARFPATTDGWVEALAYARSKATK